MNKMKEATGRRGREQKDIESLATDEPQASANGHHPDYANEGDEFLDDAIRTVDQAFDPAEEILGI